MRLIVAQHAGNAAGGGINVLILGICLRFRILQRNLPHHLLRDHVLHVRGQQRLPRRKRARGNGRVYLLLIRLRSDMSASPSSTNEISTSFRPRFNVKTARAWAGLRESQVVLVKLRLVKNRVDDCDTSIRQDRKTE